MSNCRFCLFCVVTPLCIYLSVGNKCAETEKQALLKLKHGFAYGNRILSSWSGEDCCKWKGVSCSNFTGHVTRLDLRFTNFTPVIGAEDLNNPADTIGTAIYNTSATLGGKIDSSICELQHLTFLDLSHNELEGEIPNCIGSLGQLIQLKLAWNDLVGSVPRTLSNLSNLQNLDLRMNYNLVANDLEWLSHLSNLRYLSLSYVNLSRAVDWPSSISKIPYLVELYLDDCQLPQVNPKSIPHMNSSTSLQILSLWGNELNSSIISRVLNGSKVLRVLDLSENSLQSVPDGIANMNSLQYLGLSGNSLHSVPDGIANMNSLQSLDLSSNELDGSIRNSFQTLCQVKKLFVGDNKLSGQLSDYLEASCSDLEVLDLSNNPFSSGPLPDFSRFSSLKWLLLENTTIVGPLAIDQLPNSLERLYLSHNEFNGTLPYTMGQLSNLTYLDLSSNKLNGVISEAHLLSLSRLEVLAVSRNSLSFNFNPNWVPTFQLRSLFASWCILGSQFPTWLKYQRKLKLLQISNNSIEDSFPKWFWDISSSLNYLNISHNKLTGSYQNHYKYKVKWI